MAAILDLRTTANKNPTKAADTAGQPSNITHQPGPIFTMWYSMSPMIDNL